MVRTDPSESLGSPLKRLLIMVMAAALVLTAAAAAFTQ